MTSNKIITLLIKFLFKIYLWKKIQEIYLSDLENILSIYFNMCKIIVVNVMIHVE